MTVDTSVLDPQLLAASDDLLTLSRRLDWRFLFANPVLGRVVVAGDADPELLDALHEFSEHVSMWQEYPVDNCDMLILCNPSRSLLEQALRNSNPARFYVEFDRKNIQHRLQRALCLRDLSARARHDRLRTVRAYWYWPQVKNANRIISLFASEPISFVFATGESGLRSRVLSSVLGVLRRMGLLALLVNGLGIAGEGRA